MFLQKKLALTKHAAIVNRKLIVLNKKLIIEIRDIKKPIK